jgi:ATP-dependent Clp protease ATP-binding subunit ClpA
MGARPMARVIQEQIKKKLANELLFGELSQGGLVRIDASESGLEFDLESNAVH